MISPAGKQELGRSHRTTDFAPASSRAISRVLLTRDPDLSLEPYGVSSLLA